MAWAKSTCRQMDKILSGVGIVVGGLQGGRGRQAAWEKFHGNDNSSRLPRAVELTALVAATEPPFSMNAPVCTEEASFSLV